MIALESDFIIDFLRNNKNAVEKYKEFSDEDFVTTQINFFEILFGIYNKKEVILREEPIALSFFDNLTVFDLNKASTIKSAKIAGELVLKGSLIQKNDCMIAGILLSNGCDKILTRNEKHFSKIKGLKVESY